MRVVLPPPFTSGQSPHSGMYGFDHLQWRGLLHGKGRRQRALKSAFQSLEKGKKEENCPQLLCVFVGFSVQQLQLMLSKVVCIFGLLLLYCYYYVLLYYALTKPRQLGKCTDTEKMLWSILINWFYRDKAMTFLDDWKSSKLYLY